MASQFSTLSFQTLFDAVSDAMLLADDTGLIVQANPALLELLGYSENEVVGSQIEMLLPKRYREHHHHHRSNYAKKPEKRKMGSGFPLIALTRDGSELEVDIGLSPIKSAEGNFTLATFYVADRRRRVEEQLRISEERLRLAKQSAGLGVFDFDPKRKKILCDTRLRELLGLGPEKEIDYENFIATIHPDDQAIRQAAFDEAIDPNGSGVYKVEYRVTKPSDGTKHWLACTAQTYFRNGEAVRLIGVAKDITDQKAYEKQRIKQQHEADSISTQQIARQTTSAIAHELNQPLAAISAYSEVAIHALESTPPDYQNLKRALIGCVQQSQRAGNSLHELIAFLQKDVLVKARLDINTLVKEALKTSLGSDYRKIRSVLQLEQNMPPVLGNQSQIIKILVNLLRNSIDAMHGAGVPQASITITVKTNSELNMAHVTIQDNGPGLDDNTAKRIFEPFFTTKETGIGMGLAISKSLAEANGGRLWLDRSHSPGAAFHLAIPFAPEEHSLQGTSIK